MAIDLNPSATTQAAITFAHSLNRFATFGLAPEVREEYLAETHADWVAMSEDQPAWRLLLRAIAGLPVWVWVRMAHGETTTIPSALVVALVAIGGLTAAVQEPAYPGRTRFFMVLTGVGLLAASLVLARSPRQIVMRSLGWPALAASIGVVGLAGNLPPPTYWPYDTPVTDSWLTHELIMTSFYIAGVGLALAAANAIYQKRWLAAIAGAVILAGALLMAMSQIVWGLWAMPVDTWLGLSSVVVGLAALSWAHVMPRLRHLQVK